MPLWRKINRRRHENASSTSMVIAGVLVTVLGIIISCLLCFLLLPFTLKGDQTKEKMSSKQSEV